MEKTNENIKKSIYKYIDYLKENLEIIISYKEMINKVKDDTYINEKILLNNKIEFFKQKLFNDNEFNYDINSYINNYDILSSIIDSLTNELNDIFYYIETKFGFKPIKL